MLFSLVSLRRVRFVRVGRLLRDVVPSRSHLGGGGWCGRRGGTGGVDGSGASRSHDREMALYVVLMRCEAGGAREALLGHGQLPALHGNYAQIVQGLHVVRL